MKNEKSSNESIEKSSNCDAKDDVLYVGEVSESDLEETPEDTLEDDYDEEKRAKSSVIATVITLVLALAAVLSFVFAYTSGVFTRDETRYDADATAQQEVMENAQRLITKNYEIIMLFYEYGLSHEVPDEFGIVAQSTSYAVTDSEYATLAAVQELVNSTLVKEEAEKLLKNGQGMGEIYTEQDGKLMMNIDRFVPLDYDRNWDQTQIQCDHIEESSARVIVSLSTKKEGVPITVSGTIVREDGTWKLKKLIY